MINMSETPKFIEEFSKKESPEERKQVADAIRSKRSEYFTEKHEEEEKREKLQQAVTERAEKLEKQLETIRILENEITRLSTSMLGKILNYFQLQKIKADVVIGQKTYEELKQQQDKQSQEQQVVPEKLNSGEISISLLETKTMLDDFYKGQKEKWAESEYTREDIEKNFSEEHLASLSLEDYTLLLRRFPQEMVSHVTRQGIRDHVGHMYHTAGAGSYADGFMKIVEDGRLRSPLGVYLTENEKEKAIVRFLHLDNFKTKEEAMIHLDTIVNKEKQGDPGSYVDSMAVHFATEEVADCYYGSEKGNEIFIAYPSAHIASQYYFSGQLNESSGGYWNDQWVWANEEKGIDLNAGIVFIPEESKVDKKNGSRYELDEKGNPIKNSEYIDAFLRVVSSSDFYNFANQVMEISGKFTKDWNSSNLSPKDLELLEKLQPFSEKLEKEFGITDKRLQMLILDYNHLFDLVSVKKCEEEHQGEEELPQSIDSVIEEAIKDGGILYKEAKDTISSKEFWETYFAKNSEKRPSKIVYYKGTSPTQALRDWRIENGISKKTKERDVGFFERNVERNTPEATSGLDRFKILAEKVIEDYFI